MQFVMLPSFHEFFAYIFAHWGSIITENKKWKMDFIGDKDMCELLVHFFMNILSSFLYSKGEQDKILAYIKLSFTPDDDSVTDPIQFLRDAIQGKRNNNSTKRSVISGTLHGEKVQLINTTLITGKM